MKTWKPGESGIINKVIYVFCKDALVLFVMPFTQEGDNEQSLHRSYDT